MLGVFLAQSNQPLIVSILFVYKTIVSIVVITLFCYYHHHQTKNNITNQFSNSITDISLVKAHIVSEGDSEVGSTFKKEKACTRCQ